MTLDLQKMHVGAAKRERVSEGTYPARFASIIDVGIQPQTDWKTGEPTKSQPKILITWELPTELITIEREDGTSEEAPRLISKEYTQSAWENSNLVKLLNTFKAGSITELAGMKCMLSIGSTVTGNAKVTSVVEAPSGMPVADLSKEAVCFDFDNPDKDVFLGFPGWIQTKIHGAENYTGWADKWTAEL